MQCCRAAKQLEGADCTVQAHQQQQYGLMEDCQAHMGTVEAQAGAVFGSCFQLLSRVSEVDSMVRVLHLVTVMLEALGPKAQPHFAAITSALPKVLAAVRAATSAMKIVLRSCQLCPHSCSFWPYFLKADLGSEGPLSD